MSNLEVTVQPLPRGEVFQAAHTGAIDAAEWVNSCYNEELSHLDQWNQLPEVSQPTSRHLSNLLQISIVW
ncbi:hypothetical protein VB780_00645 [Leptolyngbya sp. CCNP1308]|uniref:hypothetical protein n=1 Tax=Leptolyngbya sp. CCNP1308 TaxID=3110255 RepID=UPI002B209E2A|nr:hypothetical protein [Leptolyngbya sp. CCNP1308]MEA5447057.1 hypothetical protein [Leptolyngbya sp. CCNP1308]